MCDWAEVHLGVVPTFRPRETAILPSPLAASEPATMHEN
jgi:hypothetical protein